MPTSLSRRFRAVYLTGEHVYLRAMLLEDREHAAAWFPSPFPVNAVRAEEYLREEHKDVNRRVARYAIVRQEDDEIAGSVKIWTDRRTCDVTFAMAPWLPDADRPRAEALGLLVHWLRDEAEHMVVSIEVAADWPLTIAAAEAAAMRRSVVLRQHLARPRGRVDLYLYEALNPHWRVEQGGGGRHA